MIVSVALLHFCFCLEDIYSYLRNKENNIEINSNTIIHKIISRYSFLPLVLYHVHNSSSVEQGNSYLACGG